MIDFLLESEFFMRSVGPWLLVIAVGLGVHFFLEDLFKGFWRAIGTRSSNERHTHQLPDGRRVTHSHPTPPGWELAHYHDQQGNVRLFDQVKGA